jgi:Dihydrodipicolinate synthetase family
MKSYPTPSNEALAKLHDGCVIPAHPLALTAERKLDERRQRALSRYYLAAGAGGLAVGVHTTQFEIRKPEVSLLKPVLELAAEEAGTHDGNALMVAGICGKTEQAVSEAELASELGYDFGLLSLGALCDEDTSELIAHAHSVAEVIPLFGFYLQPSVGGRILPYSFWRQFAEIPNVCGIKAAPFNRYQTIDVLRAVATSGRADDIALYTGNDEHIIEDLLTPFRFNTPNGEKSVRFAGGLLGHWAFWTRKAVELLRVIKAEKQKGEQIPSSLLTLAAQTTDTNAVIFDAHNGFNGCIPGIHEILRRQGLLLGRWCLDSHEELSSGQMEEIDRIYADYPHLNDDSFIAEHLDEWLR